jgi:hypothetical protein
MKLKNHEKEIIGKWKFNGSIMQEDGDSLRIRSLVSSYLIFLSEDENGWDRLYQAPSDNRYWELTYPKSELHGGGPPHLKCLTAKEARDKYKIS